MRLIPCPNTYATLQGIAEDFVSSYSQFLDALVKEATGTDSEQTKRTMLANVEHAASTLIKTANEAGRKVDLVKMTNSLTDSIIEVLDASTKIDHSDLEQRRSRLESQRDMCRHVAQAVLNAASREGIDTSFQAIFGCPQPATADVISELVRIYEDYESRASGGGFRSHSKPKAK